MEKEEQSEQTELHSPSLEAQAHAQLFGFRLFGKDGPTVLIAFVLGTWALVQFISTIIYVVRDYNPLPVWDYWQVAEHLPRYRAWDWSVLWVQHNEHRILFPEAIFAIDMLAFRGLQIFALVASFACYLGIWAVLARVFAGDKQITARVRLAGVLLAALVLFWPGSSVVLGNTFLLQWTMAQFAVALSLAWLWRASEFNSWRMVTGAIISAIVATYSSGNGLLLWPVLIAAALLLRMRRTHIVALTLAGVASIALYFVGYRYSNTAQFGNLIRHPIYTLGFLCSYLSMPLGALGQPGIAVCCGAINIIAFLLAIWIARRNGLLKTGPSIVLFGLFAFALGSAALTAAGRMNPEDPKFLAALAARYVSLPLVNWAVLLLVLLWLAARLKWEVISVGTIGVLSALCIFEFSHTLRPWLRGNGSFVADKQVATVSVENDLHDPDFDGKLYGDPGFVPKMLPRLSSGKLALYADTPELDWLGKQASQVFGGCTARRGASVIGAYPVLGGTEIVGSAESRLQSAKLVFLSPDQRIIGIGSEITAGVPAVLAGADLKRQKPWAGFINGRFATDSFSTYIADGHSLCPVEGPRRIIRAEQISSAQLGPPIEGVSWVPSNWKVNGLPPIINLPHPTGETFWSSWNGSDQSTGEIRSSEIASPADHCVDLAVVHGPSTGGLQLSVSYPGTAVPSTRIPLRPDETDWKFWRIPLDAHAGRFQILGEDRGAGWGQWLAVGPPHRCK